MVLSGVYVVVTVANLLVGDGWWRCCLVLHDGGHGDDDWCGDHDAGGDDWSVGDY
jgi:hypothetical protein